jgi:5-methylcytosine-specific restriction endonuclease McrA
MASPESITRVCVVCAICGVGFEKTRVNRIYCSSYCYKRAWYRKARPASDSAMCAKCGASFPIPKGKGKRSDRRYCSKACLRAAHYVRHRSAIARRDAERRAAKRVARIVACKGCGREFSAKRIDSKFCDVACFWVWFRAQPERCQYVRVKNRQRDAVKRGASEYEPVDSAVVFRRDGWRCQLCGRVTPERLMGSLNGCAPTLDHIVPLSRGGPHTYRNTQCACRRCNLRKGAKTLGQLRLVG